MRIEASLTCGLIALSTSIALLASSGCTPQQENGTSFHAAANPANHWARLTGELHPVNGKLRFTPCSSGNQSLSITDQTPQGDLAELYARLSEGLEAPLFMDVLGEQKYGKLIVGEVLQASIEGAGCKAPAPDFIFRAFGHEPFWRLSADPGRLEFERPDDTRPHVFAYTEFLTPDGNGYIMAQNDSAHIVLQAEHQRCFDTMANAAYSHRTEVQFEGMTYQGCGYPGLLEPNQPTAVD